MAYPLSTQESSPRFDAPNSRAICGRATLTMKRSRLARTTPAQVMTSTWRGEPDLEAPAGRSLLPAANVGTVSVAGLVIAVPPGGGPGRDVLEAHLSVRDEPPRVVGDVHPPELLGATPVEGHRLHQTRPADSERRKCVVLVIPTATCPASGPRRWPRCWPHSRRRWRTPRHGRCPMACGARTQIDVPDDRAPLTSSTTRPAAPMKELGPSHRGGRPVEDPLAAVLGLPPSRPPPWRVLSCDEL